MSVVATVRYKSEEHQNPWVLDLRHMKFSTPLLLLLLDVARLHGYANVTNLCGAREVHKISTVYTRFGTILDFNR